MKKSRRATMSMKVGPTGEFPDGRLDPSDKGGINIGVGRYLNKVVLNFGGPVTSLGFSVQEAREFAQLIMRHAGILEQQLSDTRSHKKNVKKLV